MLESVSTSTESVSSPPRFCFQVEREYISYIHDGSDTQRDSFTIVANQTEIRKHSRPCTAHVNVTPVNDETPVVTANKGLKVGGGDYYNYDWDDYFQHKWGSLIASQGRPLWF